MLYAGVRLAMGPWVPRDDRPQSADRRTHFVQLRLNELGYHGGPVTGALDDAAKSAIKRYKRYHTQLYTDTTDAVTDALVARLEAGDNVRNAFDNTRFVTRDDATSKVFTDADQYYRQYADLVSPVVKVNHEKDSLGRPVFPLKAEVLLLSKYKELGDEGAGVWSPEATGPVRVRWSTEDPSRRTPRSSPTGRARACPLARSSTSTSRSPWCPRRATTRRRSSRAFERRARSTTASSSSTARGCSRTRSKTTAATRPGSPAPTPTRRCAATSSGAR